MVSFGKKPPEEEEQGYSIRAVSANGTVLGSIVASEMAISKHGLEAGVTDTYSTFKETIAVVLQSHAAVKADCYLIYQGEQIVATFAFNSEGNPVICRLNGSMHVVVITTTDKVMAVSGPFPTEELAKKWIQFNVEEEYTSFIMPLEDM